MYKRILVPIDLTEKSLGAVDVAYEFAQRFGSEVILLHVIETIEHVQFDELKGFYQRLEASALERRIIVRGYCVDADNSFPAREQALTDMHADEAGSAGNHHGGQNKLRCPSSYTALPD